jgi:hypothetical protein
VDDTFNEKCPNCKITIERINKWIDHIGCTPKKYQRYDKLLDFVKMLARERPDRDATMEWINESAQDLLREIEEID